MRVAHLLLFACAVSVACVAMPRPALADEDCFYNCQQIQAGHVDAGAGYWCCDVNGNMFDRPCNGEDDPALTWQCSKKMNYYSAQHHARCSDDPMPPWPQHLYKCVEQPVIKSGMICGCGTPQGACFCFPDPNRPAVVIRSPRCEGCG